MIPKISILIGWLTGLWLVGCVPDAPAPDADVNALYQRFHGKYKIIRSTAGEPVDVNFDGKSSDNLFEEYSHLEQHDLEINIIGQTKYHPDKSFLFTQWWPEQYVSVGFSKQWEGEPLAYNANYTANFAQQGGTRRFSFSNDLKQISVQANETEHPFRWLRPESVSVEADGSLRVVNRRRLFTTKGVKEVVITTLYKRYTLIT